MRLDFGQVQSCRGVLAAFGPLLPFVPARPFGARSEQRGRRCTQGPAGGSCCDGRRCAPTALWCSPLGRAPNSLRSLRSLRSNRRGEVSFGCALRAPTQGLRSAPSQKSPPACPCAQRLPRSHRRGFRRENLPAHTCASAVHGDLADASWFFVEVQPTVGARQGAPGGGDFWSGEERSLEVGARSAHQRLTSPHLFERSERSERSEFAARLQDEHRSGVGAKRRPLQHEPPPGAPCRAAHTTARIADIRTAATGRRQSLTQHRPFASRASSGDPLACGSRTLSL